MVKKALQRSLAGLFVGLTFTAMPGVTHATHSWGGYHWARTTPQFTLKLGDNMTTTAWKGHLSQASRDWNSGNSPVLTAIVAGKVGKRCSMVAGTTQVCNGAYGNNGWLGLASINITGGVHITQGSAKMNDTYFSTATYNNPNEKLHVVCQEIAHTFGLDHQSTDGSSQNSCMDYFSNTGANATSTLSTKPNAHDFAQLGLIYAHLDSTTTVASIAALAISGASGGTGGTDADDDENESENEDQNSWGQLTEQSSDGRSSTYERYEWDGSKTIKHVFWTIEAAINCPGCDHRYTR